MRLNRRTVIQLGVFAVVSIVAIAVMVFGYIKAPGNLFGLGRYQVTLELPEARQPLPEGERHLPRHRSGSRARRSPVR